MASHICNNIITPIFCKDNIPDSVRNKAFIGVVIISIKIDNPLTVNMMQKRIAVVPDASYVLLISDIDKPLIVFIA